MIFPRGTTPQLSHGAQAREGGELGGSKGHSWHTNRTPWKQEIWLWLLEGVVLTALGIPALGWHHLRYKPAPFLLLCYPTKCGNDLGRRARVDVLSVCVHHYYGLGG